MGLVQVLLPPFGGFINGISLSFSYSDHHNDKFFVADLIDQSIANTAQLNFVAVFMATEFGRGKAGTIQALGKFGFELFAGIVVQIAPLFER